MGTLGNPSKSWGFPKSKTKTATESDQPMGRLVDVTGINNSGTLKQKHHLHRSAQPIAEHRAGFPQHKKPGNPQVTVSPVTANRQPISNMGQQLFSKKSPQQLMSFYGGSPRSQKEGKDTTTSRPIRIATQNAVDTTTLNNDLGVSILQPQRIAGGGVVTSTETPSYGHSIDKNEFKAITGPAIQLIWRKSNLDLHAGNPVSAGIKTDPQVPSNNLNINNAGGHLLFTAPESASADRPAVTPGLQDSSEFNQPLTVADWNEAAGINLPKLAQQVSRLISRQLLVGLERRGIGKWR
jgi:hypothetical protein